jgi:hypothetical protein
VIAMRALSASQLHGVWERGQGALPFERALDLVSAACPEASPRSLAQMEIGRRDSLLLQLRELAFGPEFAMTATCPSCRETLELMLPASALRIPPAPDAAAERSLLLDGYTVRFRLPNTADIAACAGLEPEPCRLKLFDRCIGPAHCEGNTIPVQALPERVLEEIEAKMAALDPQADMRLDLCCSECRSGWTLAFDIGSFFWTEIDAWARRILLEVSVLARAFGWRESNILELSPARRQIYLAMVQA